MKKATIEKWLIIRDAMKAVLAFIFILLFGLMAWDWCINALMDYP